MNWSTKSFQSVTIYAYTNKVSVIKVVYLQPIYKTQDPRSNAKQNNYILLCFWDLNLPLIIYISIFISYYIKNNQYALLKYNDFIIEYLSCNIQKCGGNQTLYRNQTLYVGLVLYNQCPEKYDRICAES